MKKNKQITASDQDSVKSYNLVLSFFSKPIVGIIGSIASIIGLLLAIYFYLGSIQDRNMNYYVHPEKAIIASADQFSNLSLHFDGKPISSEITAAQIAFWNAGKIPIKNSNMLSRFNIKISDGKPIIEAILRKKSRDVINIKLIKDELNKGIVGIEWNILEKNDGGILQIIYSGNPQTPIYATGTVEGQGDVRKLEYSGKLRTQSEQYESFCKKTKRDGYIFLGFGLFMSILVSFSLVMRIRRGRLNIKTLLFLIVQPLIFIGFGIWMIFISLPPGPPFGF